MQKWIYALLVLVALNAAGLFVVFLLSQPSAFHRKYDHLQVGMTLTEVEAILGPGTEISEKDLATYLITKPGFVEPPDPPGGPPRTVRMAPTVSVREVQGDRFFRWRDDHDSGYIIVGMRDSRVCDKTFWEPSL